jgi:heme A synthase
MLYHMPNLKFILSMFHRFFGSRITLSIWFLATILAITPTSQLQMENESPKPYLLVIGVPFEVHNMHTNLQILKALKQ